MSHVMILGVVFLAMSLKLFFNDQAYTKTRLRVLSLTLLEGFIATATLDIETKIKLSLLIWFAAAYGGEIALSWTWETMIRFWPHHRLHAVYRMAQILPAA